MASPHLLKRARLGCNEVGGDPEAQAFASEEESTDLKLAILASLYPDHSSEELLDVLLNSDGSVAEASAFISISSGIKDNSIIPLEPPTPPKYTVQQSSLHSFVIRQPSSLSNASPATPTSRPLLTKKGRTLHLYTPASISANSPCTLIPNFLPPSLADALLQELLTETPSYSRQRFKLFDNVVTSPHTSCFYVASLEELEAQKTEYMYNGSTQTDIRQLTPQLVRVRPLVQDAVRAEIEKRIRDVYPGGRKLKGQSPRPWLPNAAFVNCYDGPKENVGYHSDQLTYLGIRPVIAGLSLGVEREFRLRRIVPASGDSDSDADEEPKENPRTNRTPSSLSPKPPARRRPSRADAAGQLAIHLPHNSLLIMHADCQESWKHAVAPARTVVPHPIAGLKRVSVTYRWYPEYMHPRGLPRCRCGITAILRCVAKKERKKQKKKGGKDEGRDEDETGLGMQRYVWMCHRGNVPGENGCGFFVGQEFDDDGMMIERSGGKGGEGLGRKIESSAG